MKIIVFSLTAFLLITIIFGFLMAVIKKEEFIGKAPIPTVWFLLAKICAFTTIILLIPYGLNVPVPVIIHFPVYSSYIALAIFLVGFLITAMTSATLKKDLIFGLPRKEEHHLQTGGIYSFSRHPFYVGFLMIMFSSVLFVPNFINIVCFIVAWTLHHLIMIREERFLTAKYGDAYRHYMAKTRRYF